MQLKPTYTKAESEHIWFTSDPHYYHTSAIAFGNRPYKDADEMNRCLIENWNNRVGMHDLVFCLGDMVFGGYEKWKTILDQLHGNIVLVMGNHDMKNYRSTLEPFFEAVVQQLYLKIDGRIVYLNHYPYLCYGGSYRKISNDAVFQLFGHLHSGPNNKIGRDLSRLDVLFPYQYDVGVDNNNYAPVSWSEVNEKIYRQYDEYLLTHNPDFTLKEPVKTE